MFVCSTNSLLIDLFDGKKKWMAKTEIIQSAQIIKEVPINKLLSIIKNFRKLLKKSVIRPEKDERIEVNPLFATHWVTIKKPFSIMKKI